MGVIQRQSILNTIVVYTGILIGFVNMLYIQPVFLQPEEIGLTRVLFSFSSLLAAFMPVGAANILIRYFPKYRNDESGHNGFVGYVLRYAFVCYLVFCIGLLASKGFITAQYEEQSKLFADNFWLVFPLSFFIVFIQLVNVYSSSLSRSVFPSFLADVVVRVLNIGIILLYHFNVINFQFFILGFIGIYGVNLLAIAAYVYSIDRPKFRFNLKDIDRPSRKTMFKYALLMAVAAMASLGLKSMDMVVLAKYVDLKTAGIYSIALYIGLFIETPLSSLDRIAGIRMAIAIAHNNQKEISDIYHKSSTNLFLIGGFLFLGVNTCITPLLSFLPEVYRGNELIVLIVSMGSLVNMASGSNTAIIYNSDHYRKGTVLMAGAFAVLIGLLYFLVPVYGILGAAISIAIGTSVVNLSKLLFIKKYFHMQPFGFDSLKLLLLIVALFVGSQYLPHTINPTLMGKDNAMATIIELVYRGSVICTAYLGLAYLLKVIPEELLKPARKYFPFINW